MKQLPFNGLSPFTVDPSLQIQVAQLHVEEIVRRREIPMTENANNILVSARTAEFDCRTDLICYVLVFDTTEDTDDFPRKDLNYDQSFYTSP